MNVVSNTVYQSSQVAWGSSYRPLRRKRFMPLYGEYLKRTAFCFHCLSTWKFQASRPTLTVNGRGSDDASTATCHWHLKPDIQTLSKTDTFFRWAELSLGTPLKVNHPRRSWEENHLDVYLLDVVPRTLVHWTMERSTCCHSNIKIQRGYVLHGESHSVRYKMETPDSGVLKTDEHTKETQ